MKTENRRIFYVDNLRIFLTALVVLHHFAITYGAPGGWFYNETEAGFPELIPLSMFLGDDWLEKPSKFKKLFEFGC